MGLQEHMCELKIPLDDRDLEALGRSLGRGKLTPEEAGEILQGMLLAHVLEARTSLRKDYDSVNEVH